MLQLLVGFLLSLAIALAAYQRRALSGSGAAGTVAVGTAIFGAAGLEWGLLLVTFFVTSSALSRYQETRKEAVAEKFAKGSRRDLGQVLANGGLGALLAITYRLSEADWVWAAYAGAIASVNADTWATELGVLSRQLPRLITGGREVEAGTSGGVTTEGTLAAFAGSVLIAVGAVVFSRLAGRPSSHPGPLLLAVTAAGLCGALLDSLLGATVQQIYFCPACGKETERHPVHRCGATTQPLRGWRWLNNDGVNFLSSAVGAGVAAGLWMWLGSAGGW